MGKFFLKFLGFLLILTGVSLVFFSLYLSFKVFFGKENPPLIFKETIRERKEERTISQKNLDPEKILQIQSQIAFKEALSEILPEEKVNKFLNLSVFSLFIFILIFASGQMVAMGLKLINLNAEKWRV